jgi:uncharacterized damage-inducible protein DinB
MACLGPAIGHAELVAHPDYANSMRVKNRLQLESFLAEDEMQAREAGDDKQPMKRSHNSLPADFRGSLYARNRSRGGSMARKAALPATGFCQTLLESYAVNERMNQLILENLDPHAWRAKPPGKARTIAAIFTHMHNVRRKWLRLSAPHLKLPAQLDRTRCTQPQARAAIAESARRCSQMLAEALGAGERRVRQFHRDGWARPWPAGAAMFTYMLVHDAQHRGQVCMLAHQMGFPLPKKTAYELWSWERLWKQCGFERPR